MSNTIRPKLITEIVIGDNHEYTLKLIGIYQNFSKTKSFVTFIVEGTSLFIKVRTGDKHVATKTFKAVEIYQELPTYTKRNNVEEQQEPTTDILFKTPLQVSHNHIVELLDFIITQK